MRICRAMLLSAVVATSVPAIAADPSFMRDLSSNDRIGLDVSKPGKSRSVSAALGMWSDDGALELGGFRDGPANGVDPAVAQAAELVSGKPVRSQGVQLRGTLYGANPDARGWAISVDARRQRVSDIGAALSGSWRTAGDSRLSIGGKLKF